MTRPILPTFDDLRALGKPRVHPNGIIQVDLSQDTRLHVWHPALPYRQKTYHPIHDHVFGFTSYCYSGRIVHVEYRPTMWGTSTLYNAWAAEVIGPEETILKQLDNSEVGLVPQHPKVLQPGGVYGFHADDLHEILFNEPSLTIMVKDGLTLQQGNARSPRIMVPVGVTPDNDFRRADSDEAVIWELIKEAYPS